MTKPAANPRSSRAAPDEFVALHALAAALPSDGEAPEWVTIFPKSGVIETRDDRRFTIDAEALISRFRADGVDLPVDINHATHHASLSGARADAVGWIVDLKVAPDGSLLGKIDWLNEGRSLLQSRAYKFVSPDFFHTADRKATWLRSLALVTAPAIGNQQALAAASSMEPAHMKNLAAALGVVADATEETLVAALSAGFVDKKVHDEVVAQLNARSKELNDLKAAERQARVDALLEAALKEKKILPAERDHYASLCATDAGLDSVKSLLAARSAALPTSGLDKKETPAGGDLPPPSQLALEADKMVRDGAAANVVEAVTKLQEKYASAV
jgi:phage I-like protein